MEKEKIQIEACLKNLDRWDNSLAHYLIDYNFDQTITTEELFKSITPVLKEVQMEFKKKLKEFEQCGYDKLNHDILQELIDQSKGELCYG
jgi:hypothetical protein